MLLLLLMPEKRLRCHVSLRKFVLLDLICIHTEPYRRLDQTLHFNASVIAAVPLGELPFGNGYQMQCRKGLCVSAPLHWAICKEVGKTSWIGLESGIPEIWANEFLLFYYMKITYVE